MGWDDRDGDEEEEEDGRFVSCWHLLRNFQRSPFADECVTGVVSPVPQSFVEDWELRLKESGKNK